MPDRIVSAQTGDLNPSRERIRALDVSMILLDPVVQILAPLVVHHSLLLMLFERLLR